MDGLDCLITVGGAPLDGERHRAHAEAGNLIAGKCRMVALWFVRFVVVSLIAVT